MDFSVCNEQLTNFTVKISKKILHHWFLLNYYKIDKKDANMNSETKMEAYTLKATIGEFGLRRLVHCILHCEKRFQLRL